MIDPGGKKWPEHQEKDHRPPGAESHNENAPAQTFAFISNSAAFAGDGWRQKHFGFKCAYDGRTIKAQNQEGQTSDGCGA
jgi:hypothetical protein